jgi:hypothetical protein
MGMLINIFRADLRRQPPFLMGELTPFYALSTIIYAVGLIYVLVLWADFVEVEVLLHTITHQKAETLLRQKLQMGAVFLCIFYLPLLLRRLFFSAFLICAGFSFFAQFHDLSEYFLLSFSPNQVERIQQQFIFFNFNLLSLIRVVLLGLLIWAAIHMGRRLRGAAA